MRSINTRRVTASACPILLSTLLLFPSVLIADSIPMPTPIVMGSYCSTQSYTNSKGVEILSTKVCFDDLGNAINSIISKYRDLDGTQKEEIITSYCAGNSDPKEIAKSFFNQTGQAIGCATIITSEAINSVTQYCYSSSGERAHEVTSYTCNELVVPTPTGEEMTTPTATPQPTSSPESTLTPENNPTKTPTPEVPDNPAEY